MERSLFGFILRYSRRDQLLIVPFVLASMLFYYASLDLPKTIINQPIQGKGFPTAESTRPFLRLAFDWPNLLGGGTTVLFHGFALERTGYLFALTFTFLALIIIGGLLKLRINTMKGWMGERMLRRLRYALFDHILRFPLPHFRRVKSAEMATMIKDEIEPLGGFVGESIITPLYLGGQALTALFFILFQHIYLGMLAFGMVVLQAVIIPRMRRRLLELSRQRQLAARQLAGRIAECVDGIVEIHAHDTSNYERAELSARLHRLFRIRFEHFQRKFMIKFLNNLLSQITPFLFYSVGGYLAIVGRLDIGALVAVIAAYKDLPGPVKELIDWDQERMDASLKYQQVIEQFTLDDIAPPEQQALIDQPELPASGELVASNLALSDDSGTKIVSGVSFSMGLESHVAIVGGNGAGGGEIAQLVSGLLVPDSGVVHMGGVDLTRSPEAVTGRAVAYVGGAAYLFPNSVRENLLYGLKHRPVAPARYEGAASRHFDAFCREAQRAGNTTLDYEAQWIDYAAAGCSGPEQMEERLMDVIQAVDLQDTLFEIGMRSAVPADRHDGLPERILQAREVMRQRLSSPALSDLVERFDARRYNRNATLGENLLFGTPVGKVFDVDNLAANAHVRAVLDQTGLSADLLSVGHKLAETMLELFSDLPPGHELFERFSFIAYDDLPAMKEVVAQVGLVGLERLSQADRSRLLGLPFKLIVSKHRLGLIDDALEARVLDARRRFAEGMPADMRDAIEFFDPARFNRAASLQDNILFGKIVSGVAGGAELIGQLTHEILDELSLRPQVLTIGMDYQVGTGGARLSVPDRQKVAIARALLRRPTLLVLDQAAAVLDPRAQERIVANILAMRMLQGVIWVLNRTDLADRFDQVLVMAGGHLVEQGTYSDLMERKGALHRMIAA